MPVEGDAASALGSGGAAVRSGQAADPQRLPVGTVEHGERILSAARRRGERDRRTERGGISVRSDHRDAPVVIHRDLVAERGATARDEPQPADGSVRIERHRDGIGLGRGRDRAVERDRADDAPGQDGSTLRICRDIEREVIARAAESPRPDHSALGVEAGDEEVLAAAAGGDGGPADAQRCACVEATDDIGTVAWRRRYASRQDLIARQVHRPTPLHRAGRRRWRWRWRWRRRRGRGERRRRRG